MRIAVTGGSGSLGRALLKRLTTDGADRIVTFSRDEQKRALLAADFGWHPGIRIMAGDVRDTTRMADLFYGCEVVIHAAARKVVTAHPDEPEEMHKTNVVGTTNVIEAAHKAGVGKLLLISSDKAVRAENVYGTSKSMAEYLTINANGRTYPQGLRCSAVRYGNVLASTGSVLVSWKRFAGLNLPLPLSSPHMTRFWLTLPQAVDHVLRAVADMRGGEIFVPEIPAAPLTRLGDALMPAGESASYQITGIRPGGEKLHEELLSAAEVRRVVRRNGFYVVPPYVSDSLWDNRPWLGDPVPPGFTYNSETWDQQLTVDAMRALVAEADADGIQATKGS